MRVDYFREKQMKSKVSSCGALFFNALMLSFLVVGLAGCGGGGGGSSSVDTTPTVVIDSGNAPTVVGAAVQAGVGAALTPIAVATSTPRASVSPAATMKAIGSVVGEEITKFGSQSQAPVIVTGAAQTYYCVYSGSKIVNGAGSSGTITYNDCSNVVGYSKTGTISVSNIVSNASVTSGNVVINLTMTSPYETLTIKGDIAVTLTATTMNMHGSSLKYTSSVSGTRTVYNYNIDINLTTGELTESFSVDSAAQGGMVTVSITTPFTFGSGWYPNAGVATVTGANSTKLRATVLGDENAPVNSQIMFELSTDGGATYGTPTYVTWASLNIII